MSIAIEKPRSELELAAILRSLTLTRGAAPDWLRSELAIRTRVPRSAPDPKAYQGHMAAALSVGCLLTGFLGCVDLVGEVSYEPPKHVVIAPVADQDGLEAIALAQDWRAAGDDKPVLVRLAATVRNPAYPRAWSAEKTEADAYLVIFRAPAGYPVYAFEVNLESEEVTPTPEAVERLTFLRLHEEAAAVETLVAHAP